ncbi:proteasome regulatory particle base subunit rpn10 [Mycoemilia scoparia]|uniref:Proteasome regulatory particle base subunit rpn10 n=1 Tax=Mycoemilia scoparia TaxID=417184 RepID=A0A9W7ZW14_9FUNG|nr:proteasome regulatory particle base subunit rpn10 [Mycoemilia scoparia]
MVKEAAVIILDNSEYSRNEDIYPSRFEAQLDAAEYIFSAKLSDNAETNVAVVSGAGNSVSVLTSLTAQRSAFGRVKDRLEIEGTFSFVLALNISRMVLKNTPISSKRVIVFISGPLTEDEITIESVAKKMRKNNICVDLVDLSGIKENERKVELFHNTVNKDQTSNLLIVETNGETLRNQVRTALFTSGRSGGFGDLDDPTVDHELAEAIRLSLQEVGGASANADSQQGANAQASGTGPDGNNANIEESEEDRDIRLAIEMSLRESAAQNDPQNDSKNKDPRSNDQ